MSPFSMGMVPTPMYNPMLYNTMNFNSYALRNYGITRMMIDAHARILFMKYDFNCNGLLGYMELYQLMCEFFYINGLGWPNVMDIMYLMYLFDVDGSGNIDYFEFEMMLEALGGR